MPSSGLWLYVYALLVKDHWFSSRFGMGTAHLSVFQGIPKSVTSRDWRLRTVINAHVHLTHMGPTTI